ncbi:MAG TPA: class I SAM-dependent methyltransferase [Candidatus Methylacidiphilales bacterium]
MKIGFYKSNQSYSENLRDTDPRRHQSLPSLCASQEFYAKYSGRLSAGCTAGQALLDVGCGVGQVVRALQEQGLRAHGIDVSETSIEIARKSSEACQVYDGQRIPFPDGNFQAVGAFNVLEHVEDPIAFLDEAGRVLAPGGRMIISSPNFLRVLGWKDYHPHMRGIGRKWKNLRAILARRDRYSAEKEAVIFEKMIPIVRPNPMPDDDATVVTNSFDLQRYFQVRGYGQIKVSCVDRPVPRLIEWGLDATPLRFLVLNSFVEAIKAP